MTAPLAAPLAASLTGISTMLDSHLGYQSTDPVAVTWGRIAKIGEEFGEVIAAYIGATGQNPRKGVTHTSADVFTELLDVAIAALGAAEHLRGNDGKTVSFLELRADFVARRLAGDREARPTWVDMPPRPGVPSTPTPSPPSH